MICSSTFNFDEISDTDVISDVKKKTKFKKLYLRGLTKGENRDKKEGVRKIYIYILKKDKGNDP